MKLASIIGRVVIVLIGMCLACTDIVPASKPINKEPKPDEIGCVFYGDGQKIPVYAVRLLVRSEFVRMTLSEIDTLQKYFPSMTRHICPFTHCPMLEQVNFHGCGACEEGTDCYALDQIHWDHPTWSYDECEALLFNGTMGKTVETKLFKN